MALSPLQNTSTRAEVIETEVQPSLTYAFDFETGEFTSKMIDETEAVRQFVKKAILTSRLRYLIYDDQYGSEIDSLITENLTPEMVQMEVQRMITEAVIYDERIESVSAFSVEQIEDRLYITFTITTNTGVVIGEEVIV